MLAGRTGNCVEIVSICQCGSYCHGEQPGAEGRGRAGNGQERNEDRIVEGEANENGESSGTYMREG